MDSLLTLGGFELAKKIKHKEVSSLDVVEAHIERIKEVQPKLNALVEDRFDKAIAQAKECDQQIAHGKQDLPPLFGVPYTIKEMMAIKGHRSTLGSLHHKNRIMDEDATMYERLTQAGAILMGMTNVPEVGFWFETYNKVYGRTNNPYDLKRTCGGSSGGEGALIAAGASPFGIGSDIGGSIRIPAAFCGVFGHKPTWRVLPFTGHAPLYKNNYQEFYGSGYPFTVVGPMARKASDLYDLMQVLIGPDGYDPEVKKDFKLQARVKSWRGKKVFLLPKPNIKLALSAENDLVDAVNTAGKHFESLGAEVVQMDSSIFKDIVALWFARGSQVTTRNFNRNLNPHGPINFLKELLLTPLGESNYTFPPLIVAIMEKMGSKDEKIELVKKLNSLRDYTNQMLGDNGIIIMPTHSRKAPIHYTPTFTPFDFAYTAIFNALHQPATSVPMGLSASGLPKFVQVAAAEDMDHLTLSAAEELEKAFGGWVPANI